MPEERWWNITKGLLIAIVALVLSGITYQKMQNSCTPNESNETSNECKLALLMHSLTGPVTIR